MNWIVAIILNSCRCCLTSIQNGLAVVLTLHVIRVIFCASRIPSTEF